MSNPLPLADPAPAPKVTPPNKIDPEHYPALEQLRSFCHRGGTALIDRVYAEAQAMYAELRTARGDDLL